MKHLAKTIVFDTLSVLFAFAGIILMCALESDNPTLAWYALPAFALAFLAHEIAC